MLLPCVLARLLQQSQIRLTSKPAADRRSALLPAVAELPRNSQGNQLNHSFRAIVKGMSIALAIKLTI
ncbi:hypothetical protein [Synechococcus sp. UW179A]|uniref:hypothetical protein n=1 Tax=Synechococcus sp. UW179A TaxID=2575510 RepID=UPI0010BEDD9E|nr:hypothetical protein [Synechococcus sp. UW179A]